MNPPEDMILSDAVSTVGLIRGRSQLSRVIAKTKNVVQASRLQADCKRECLRYLCRVSLRSTQPIDQFH